MRVLKCECAQRGSCNMLLHVWLSPGFLWNMLLEDLLKFPSASKGGSRDVVFDHSANNKSAYPWVSHVLASSPDGAICGQDLSLFFTWQSGRIQRAHEQCDLLPVPHFVTKFFPVHLSSFLTPYMIPWLPWLHHTPLWTHFLLYPLWCLSPPPLLSFTFHLLISLILFLLYSYLSPQAEWVRCDHNSGSKNYQG